MVTLGGNNIEIFLDENLTLLNIFSAHYTTRVQPPILAEVGQGAGQ